MPYDVEGSHAGPGRKHDGEAGIDQNLLEFTEQNQNDAASCLQQDSQGRRLKPTADAAEGLEKYAVARHSKIHAWTSNGHGADRSQKCNQEDRRQQSSRNSE